MVVPQSERRVPMQPPRWRDMMVMRRRCDMVEMRDMRTGVMVVEVVMVTDPGPRPMGIRAAGCE